MIQSVGMGNGIYWLGTPNPDLRVFDVVMKTPHGTSYNSYLIKDEKTAVIDVVKRGFFDDYSASITSLVDPSSIDYIVLNHTEPDHTGDLGRLLEMAPQATVVGSKSAIRLAKLVCHREFRAQAVGDGDSIDLGGRTLKFISAPFLHWPDTIFTYSESDRTLFPCDFLGCHYWNGQLFAEGSDEYDEAFSHYFDAIMSPFKKYVCQAIEKIRPLAIDVIAPSHGPVISQSPWLYIDRYYEWSKIAVEPRSGPDGTVIVAECSAYGNTKLIGDAIAEGLMRDGQMTVERYDLQEEDSVDQVLGALERADGLLVGSPTFNRDALSVVWNLLALVPAVTYKGMPAGAYGSYGWSGEAVAYIHQRFDMLNLSVVQPGVRANMVPTDEELAKAREYGVEFAAAVNAKIRR